MSQKKINKREFWVTNTLQKKNVSLADLALTIPAGRTYNLLDSKHFSYTLEQLEKSATSGSIHKKGSYIKVRNVAPKVIVKPGLYIAKGPNRLGQQLRSAVEIDNPKFEELDYDERPQEEKMAEELFAKEYADAAAYDDHRPVLTVDKKFDEVEEPEKDE